MNANYQIKRNMPVNITLRKLNEKTGDFDTISVINKNEKINGKNAIELNDDELISDFLNNGTGWSH